MQVQIGASPTHRVPPFTPATTPARTVSRTYHWHAPSMTTGHDMERPLYPFDPRYSAIARRARREIAYANAVSTWSAASADHPAIRAAIGRLLYHQGAVPQRGATSIESVAWHRESGAIPGMLNRGERRSR